MYDSLFHHKAGGEQCALAHSASSVGETSETQGDEIPQAGLLPFAYPEQGVLPHSGVYESDNDKSIGNIHIPA